MSKTTTVYVLEWETEGTSGFDWMPTKEGLERIEKYTRDSGLVITRTYTLEVNASTDLHTITEQVREHYEKKGTL